MAKRKSCDSGGLTEEAADEVDVSTRANEVKKSKSVMKLQPEKTKRKSGVQAPAVRADLMVFLLYNRCIYSYMKAPSGGREGWS